MRTAVTSLRGQKWHVRGLAWFATSLLMMAAAAAVTGTFSTVVLLVLVGGLAVTVAMLLVLAVGGLAEHPRSLLLWPVATCTTLLVYSLEADFAATLLNGLIVLAFLFIGLCQRPGTAIWLAPPAAYVMVVTTNLDLSSGVIRVPIAVVVWLVVSELPARLIGELVRQREVLRELARTDALTGLMNRSGLAARLAATGPTGSVALIDIDHFKAFNDTFGHVAGDQVLADFAEVLRTVAGDPADVFRYGGEEFLVIFPVANVEQASAALREMGVRWAALGSGLTFSGGVAGGGPDAVREADRLLYGAKSQGRAQVVC